MSNCLFEATLQKIEAECNCTPKYFTDIVEGWEACEGHGKQCMTKLIGEMGESRTIEDKGVTKVSKLCKIWKGTFINYVVQILIYTQDHGGRKIIKLRKIEWVFINEIIYILTIIQDIWVGQKVNDYE